MQADQSSRTAEYMALFRALLGRLPAGQRLFADPLARDFLGLPLRVAVDLARIPGMAQLVCRFIDQRWPGVRTSAAARTRLIDDRVVAAVAGGARQVVILGAGFDARAIRLAALGHCPVFEVDHPATQARKRRLLGARAPANVRFVPTDFAMGRLGAAIAAQGYDVERRSVVIWEGVTNYLTAGERWTFGFDPRRLAAYLRERGLELLEDIGAAEYRSLCYGPAAMRMKGYEFHRVARARVDADRAT